MTRASKVLIVMMVTACGLWGCAQGPAGSAALAERIRALEAKCAKFEEDYRAVAFARDQAKKTAAALELDKAQLQKELTVAQAVMKERDELRAQMEVRTGERDLLQARCDHLKKGIQSLLGQDDALISPHSTPAAAAAPAAPTTPATANVVDGPIVGGGKL